ncbi:hypothetical protein LZ30DRAFT_470196 [Colletotrichum cereale]|nr:hypothetical protein LZ30DRAFT_470196 [Colletotrichum cereale]
MFHSPLPSYSHSFFGTAATTSMPSFILNTLAPHQSPLSPFLHTYFSRPPPIPVVPFLEPFTTSLLRFTPCSRFTFFNLPFDIDRQLQSPRSEVQGSFARLFHYTSAIYTPKDLHTTTQPGVPFYWLLPIHSTKHNPSTTLPFVLTSLSPLHLPPIASSNIHHSSLVCPIFFF